MAKTVRSRKSKGMKLQKIVVEMILDKFPILSKRDVKSIPASVPGTDIELSEVAFFTLPLSIECKNSEHIAIWQAIKQAEQESRKGIPVVVFKRNRSDIYCCLKFKDFLDNFQRGI